MGESACLMHTFSYASGIPNEAKQGNPIHALGDSVSFGRFTSESLSWEKWSSFSHNRYVEEAERYAQPGSVAQKKAFFEAHYKRIAAKKAAAAALLEQENAANTNPEQDPEDQDCDSTTHDAKNTTTNSQVPVGEEVELKNPGADIGSIANIKGEIISSAVEMEDLKIGKVKGADSVTEHEQVAEAVNLMKDEPLDQLANFGNQYLVSESPQMEKPLLEQGFKSSQEAPSPVSKKKPEFTSSKPPVLHRAPKFPASPAKTTASIHSRKENNVTPITRKSPVDSVKKKRATSKSLHTLIYSTPGKEPDKILTTTPAAHRADSSKVAPCSYKAYTDCKTPLRTPTMAYTNGVSKYSSATPCSENTRPKTPLDPPASGSKTTCPKWHILNAVFRTEERAARRKQKLEEKFNAKDAEKVQLQTRLKEKAETELRKLRQSLCFKARPLPDFYKDKEPPKNPIKNVKTPLTQPRSPKLGRKPSSITPPGLISLPQETHTAKNSGPRNVPKMKSWIPKPLTSLPERTITHENVSPNIQPDQQKHE